MDASLVISIAALVIAIVFGIRQQIHSRKVDQELLSGGTTLLEVRWSWQNERGPVNCEAQVKEVPLSEVTIRSKRDKKFCGDLSKGEKKPLTFDTATKGEKWTVTFRDPNRKPHKGSCLIWGNDTGLFG